MIQSPSLNKKPSRERRLLAPSLGGQGLVLHRDDDELPVLQSHEQMCADLGVVVPYHRETADRSQEVEGCQLLQATGRDGRRRDGLN